MHEEYIKTLEQKFLGEEGLVSHYDENKTGLLKRARYAFWILIFLMSFAIFIVAPPWKTSLRRCAPAS